MTRKRAIRRRFKVFSLRLARGSARSLGSAVRISAKGLAWLLGWSLHGALWLGHRARANPLVRAIGRRPAVRRWRRRLGPLVRPGVAVAALLACAVAIATLVRPHVLPDPDFAELAGNDEASCLALNIYHEARGEPDRGKLAVGHVVMNRVHDKRFPDKVCAVIQDGGENVRHRCQFSWWCDGRSDRPSDKLAWAESQALAAKILAGAASDPTGGALWYHADHVAPAWGARLVAGPQIGRHQFYLSH